MKTSFKTGIQVIDNNVEYKLYMKAFKDLEKAIDSIDEIITPIEDNIRQGMEDYLNELWYMMKKYDEKRFNKL